jgi:SOS regulatory protein LexA
MAKQEERQVDRILDFYRDSRRMPTYEEMMDLLGYKSKSAVHYFIQKLVAQGILERDSTGHLVPRMIGHVRILGLVEAGFPTSAAEELIDTISLDEFLINKKEATYLLKVKGESMKDAGILPGDLVLVERGAEPRVGDIVIAEVDGEYTMKRYRMRGNKPYLEASNREYEDIYPENELKIPAVVRAVIRKYK